LNTAVTNEIALRIAADAGISNAYDAADIGVSNAFIAADAILDARITNTIMDVNGVEYTITNAAQTGYILEFSAANSTAWYVAKSSAGTYDHTVLTNQDGDTSFLHLDAAEKAFTTNAVALHAGTNITFEESGTNLTINAKSYAAETTGLSNSLWNLGTGITNAFLANDTVVSNVFDTKLNLSGGEMTGDLNMGGQAVTNVDYIKTTNYVWVPVNGVVYFGTSTNYIKDQGGTNFLFKSGTNSANFGW